MSGIKRDFTDVLEFFGKRYIEEYLEGWDSQRLESEWYPAFHFFLHHLYFHGRNDKLSERYWQNMKACLDQVFLAKPTVTLKSLWKGHHIPQNQEWKGFREGSTALWNRFDKTMGKRRDLEMTLDTLRYLYDLPRKNIVLHSLKMIRKGEIQKHRNDLMQIYGAGPKTSAFYLRDLVFLFKIDVSIEDALTLQPVDTWVKKLIGTLIEDAEDYNEVDRCIVSSCRSGFQAALVNAGAWYIGSHAFDLLIDLLSSGKLSAETLMEVYPD